MAAGQTSVMAKYVSNMTLTGLPVLWVTDTIKAAYVTATLTPAKTDSDPRWGAGGAQDYSTNEVTAGGHYSAGGVTLTGNTSTLAGAVTSLNTTSPIAVAANAANPTNDRWLI